MSDSFFVYECIGDGLEATSSQMFGKPCYKTNGKASICFFQDCLVCKLTGDADAEALALEGAILFDLSGKGRAMKEWVQIPFFHKVHWKNFTKAALEYVTKP